MKMLVNKTWLLKGWRKFGESNKNEIFFSKIRILSGVALKNRLFIF